MGMDLRWVRGRIIDSQTFPYLERPTKDFPACASGWSGRRVRLTPFSNSRRTRENPKPESLHHTFELAKFLASSFCAHFLLTHQFTSRLNRVAALFLRSSGVPSMLRSRQAYALDAFSCRGSGA